MEYHIVFKNNGINMSIDLKRYLCYINWWKELMKNRISLLFKIRKKIIFVYMHGDNIKKIVCGCWTQYNFTFVHIFWLFCNKHLLLSWSEKTKLFLLKNSMYKFLVMRKQVFSLHLSILLASNWLTTILRFTITYKF